MKFRQNYRVRLLPHGLWPIAPWLRLIWQRVPPRSCDVSLEPLWSPSLLPIVAPIPAVGIVGPSLGRAAPSLAGSLTVAAILRRPSLKPAVSVVGQHLTNVRGKASLPFSWAHSECTATVKHSSFCAVVQASEQSCAEVCATIRACFRGRYKRITWL
jgi:hypothetical protein